VDNAFAERFFKQIAESPALPWNPSASRLCKRCYNIDLCCSINQSSLEETAESCDLCRMLSQCFEQHGLEDHEEIMPLSSRSILSIHAAPETRNAHPDIQIGFPALPDVAGLIHFELLREWLKVCDNEHEEHHCHLRSPALFPTRLIDVGHKRSHSLRLHCPKQGEAGDYVVLSHCWGNLTKEQKDAFNTSRKNIDARFQGIDLKTLPQTYQDAVRVTRELDKQYLWIDSLCIIQGGDGDWQSESERMETVFRNAYCTIAASSAADSTVGFLGPEKRARKYVKVPKSSHGPIYVCEAIDDFHGDVEDNLLNKRAWVLQERALSRRTIHFTTCQSYWECGAGVQCQTLTRMHNSKSLFLGDPRFPMSLLSRFEKDRITLFQYLFRRYSRLGITVKTDRSVAISGLEKRLVETFETEGQHGVTEKYLHRSLLWQRDGDPRMKRILYKNRKVPSWSWMAYEGHIKYMPIEFGTVGWNEIVRFGARDTILEAQVKEFRHCRVERSGTQCEVSDKTDGSEGGWLRYDEEDCIAVETVKCVIIGSEIGREAGSERQYYILLVTPPSLGERLETGLEYGSEEGLEIYKRVGVGSLLGKLIWLDGPEVKAWII
jgi:hypothetical protein